jgi:stage II sporulation protein GA (sporulation sigma-E factor processing peptidase)
MFFKLFTVFAVVSAVFAGVATALWYTVAPAGFMVVGGVIYYDAPASLLIVFTAVSYVAMLLYERLRRRTAPKNRVYTLQIQDNGKQLVCSLLYDSGCTLKEPFSGRPALIIDRTAAETILPRNWLEDANIARDCGVRFIPFETVGGEGALPAFCPKRMIIADKNGGRFDVSGSFLAVSDALGHGEYAALCGTDIGDILERG